MILSGLKIEKEVAKGNIKIEPYCKELLNPNSYNYRLCEVIYEVVDDIIDSARRCSVKEIIIPDEGYILYPNKLYLGSTLEKIGSNKYVTQLIGRSSIGRLGLFLQVTAPLGHVGCNHCWTLELRVTQPLRIYPRMRIGQVTFWRIYGNTTLNYLNGKYNAYSRAEISKFYESGGLK